MADSDSFVQEVTEEVRRDAMFAAWQKYGPWVIGALLIVIFGTAGRAWWLSQKTEEMREKGGAYLSAQSIDDRLVSAEAFNTLAETSEGNYAALAGLRAGAAFGQSGNVERAVEEYETVAAMPEIDPRLKSLAELRSVMVRGDTMDPDDMLERLQPLTAPDGVWRPLALEFEANALLRKGNREGAIDSLQSLIQDDRAPAAARARVSEMILSLGGTVAETATVPETPEAKSTGENTQ